MVETRSNRLEFTPIGSGGSVDLWRSGLIAFACPPQPPGFDPIIPAPTVGAENGVKRERGGRSREGVEPRRCVKEMRQGAASRRCARELRQAAALRRNLACPAHSIPKLRLPEPPVSSSGSPGKKIIMRCKIRLHCDLI